MKWSSVPQSVINVFEVHYQSLWLKSNNTY